MTANTAAENQQLFLLALREILPSLRQASDKILASRMGKEKLANAASELLSYVESGVASPLTKNEKFGLMVQVMKCLANYISRVMGVPVTINTVTNNFHLLSFAVDRAFPSYHETKLLKYVILSQAS